MYTVPNPVNFDEQILRLVQNYFCQQMHCLLKHKMLQFVHKISLYMAPTCFGPSWTTIREHTIGALLKLLKSPFKIHH